MAFSRWFLNRRSWAKVMMPLGVAFLAIWLSACDQGKEAEKAKQAASPPPPQGVVVAEVIQKTVPIYSEHVARTEAKDTVEIRARVQAFLMEQHFTEGTVVKKDQLLFTLDKREYEALLLQAKAQLAKAQADLAFAKDNATVQSAKANVEAARARLGKAETDERRLKPLADQKAVPKQDYDDATANLDVARADLESRKASLNTTEVNQKSGIAQAEAAVQAAEAAIAQADLNLSYCTIKSPIEGLIGMRKVAPGNLVGKGEATLLVTVSSIDPIRVELSVSDAEYLRLKELRKKGQASSGAEMELILADGTTFPHKGKATIAERDVDLKTGTLSILAEFPNPDGLLRPGQFGRVRVAAEVAENAILVPRRAVQETQGQKTVLVVGEGDVVTQRTIEAGKTVGDLLIVLNDTLRPNDMLKPGERVIVDGIQKARPGSKVSPTAAGTGSPGTKAEEKAQAKAAETKPDAKAGKE